MMRWYALLTNAGHENKVRNDLIQRLTNAGKMRHVREIIAPTQEVTEIKDGEKKTKEVRILPGYLLVQAELPLVYSEVLNTKGVRSFVGPGGEPSAMSQVEVDRMLGRSAKNERKPAGPAFKVGETVRITTGPLADFTGEISDVDEGGGKLTVLVPIFGRTTPAEVEWSQVRKDS